ncbi:hypothetical protein HK101_007861 [Irineochytrium annulatum]|nr:hypothetical protein HK101_007861 [Irineochytrium annulatum]
MEEADGNSPWSHFTREELDAAAKVLRVYVENPELKSHAASHPEVSTVLALARQLIDATPEELKGRRRDRAKKRLEEDHKTLEVTGIRSLRKVRMVGMTGGSVGLPAPPRVGAIETNAKWAEEDDARIAGEIATEGAAMQLSWTGEAAAEDPIAASSASLLVVDPKPEDLPPPRKLNFKRSCHICGKLFTELHSFYDQMCPDCAQFNYAKRFSKADMTGRVCIVTGARVKIGYAIALKLLRMGAKVIVTTRFPHNAAVRFSEEPDAANFKGRLTIYGLDFRDLRMLHHFTAHVKAAFGRLDVIINNAAQTVRRPPEFFRHLLEGEGADLPTAVLDVAEVIDVFRSHHGLYDFRRVTADGAGPSVPSVTSGKLEVVNNGNGQTGSEQMTLSTSGGRLHGVTPAMGATVPFGVGSTSLDLNASAGMSQVAVVDGDGGFGEEVFPPGLYDRDDQQVDLRVVNSWKLEMGQISTVEMIECQLINSFAPWILISELKPCMMATHSPRWKEGDPDDSFDKIFETFLE